MSNDLERGLAELARTARERQTTEAAQKAKQVDLASHEWNSDRPQKREPIFGDGALPFAGEIIATVAVFGLLILACWLGLYLKGEAYSLLYGPPANADRPPTRAEIEAEMKRRGVTIDGYTIKRID